MSFIRTRHHRLHPDSGFVLPEREVTPQAIYADRRRLLQGLAGVAGYGFCVTCFVWSVHASQ